jgi:hypothetical protein
VDQVADAVVDSVRVVAEPGQGFTVRGHATSGADELRRILEAFVTVNRADGEFLLEGVRRRQSRATDGGAYAFGDVSGRPGVVIEVGAGRAVLVSEDAFSRLMERLAQALGSPTGEE